MTGRTLRQLVVYVVLAAFAVLALYPLFWMFTCSWKTSEEATEDKWGLPDTFVTDNFKRVVCGSPSARTEAPFGIGSDSFLRYVLNSVIVTSISVLLTLIAASLAGFAFARMRFRGGTVLFFLILGGMMIPVHIVLIPLVKIFGFLQLYDTHAALVMSYVAFSLPVSVFILRGFFEGVPRELEEAARIDGCSEARVFWHVMLPLAKPAIAVIIIFNFVTLWNEFIFALTLIGTDTLRTIPLGVFQFSEEFGWNVPLLCAAMTVSVLPLVAVYALVQKHIIRGLTSGALKG